VGQRYPVTREEGEEKKLEKKDEEKIPKEKKPGNS